MPRGIPLTEGEIQERLVRLRNLERLHAVARERIARQEEQIAAQAARIAQLESLNEKLLLRVEELERMVFGRKRSREETPPDAGTSPPSSVPHLSRSPSSYRRPIPSPSVVTAEEYVSVAACRHCGRCLSAREERVRYVEDIDLALLRKARTVTKVTIERGYCARCGQWTAAEDLRGSPVTFGPNIRNLVCFSVTILDQTYEQVRTLLEGLCGFPLTDGEISQIVQERGLRWRPAYERLKTRIRAGPGSHLDETGFEIQALGYRNFGWVMSGTEGPEVVYRLADNRGKGNAEELLGGGFQGVRITDGYPAYKNLAGKHQVCWAHLLRKSRELGWDADALGPERAAHCREWSVRLHRTYATLSSCHAEPYTERRRIRQAGQLRRQVRALVESHPLDPKKLADLKAFLHEYEHALFTCLTVDGIPSTNNQAERDLRKLVLKRKKSFGCKTERGAKALEVILSICWSLWHRNPTKFFPALAKLSTDRRRITGRCASSVVSS